MCYGTMLCVAMSRLGTGELNAEGLENIYAFLGSKPIVDRKNRGSFCP